MYKIMVIEDDPAIREELEVLLKNSLYESVCPQSFEDPAGQILREAPDLVLLDVNLPGENGIQVCRKLRNASDVPVIFVTSRNTSMAVSYTHLDVYKRQFRRFTGRTSGGAAEKRPCIRTG